MCVTWNRLILLHGPPGSGKTSLWYFGAPSQSRVCVCVVLIQLKSGSGTETVHSSFKTLLTLSAS